MGDIYLDLTVANLSEPENQKGLEFLVDTGATRAWISEEEADSLRIRPVGTVPVELANGTIVELP